MNQQLQTALTPNGRPRPKFPSTSQMLHPQHQSFFYNTQIFPPQPSPPINPPPFKRQRILQTPTDHKTICHIKKVERQTIKSMTPCTTHQTGMVEIPYQILKCVQAQGLKLSRTNETIEYLSEQVTSLHEMVKTALLALRSSRQPPKDTKKTPHPLLKTYLTLVTQTLESLNTNPPSSTTLQATSDFVKKLHQLIQLQCNFDALGGSPSESTNDDFLNRLCLLGLTLPTTPTLGSVLTTLQKMEQNLKTFINLQGNKKKVDNGALAKTRNNGEPSSGETTPLQQQQPRSRSAAPTTSTPVKTKRRTRNPKRKDKDEDNHDGIGASFGNLSVIPHAMNNRTIVQPTKSFSFSYVRNSMEVD